MSDLFDGIILGTGHNALILQAYLARTEDALPGPRLNSRWRVDDD
jgi:hypothetical protein